MALNLKSMLPPFIFSLQLKNIIPASSASFTCLTLRWDGKRTTSRLPDVASRRWFHASQQSAKAMRNWEKKNEKVYPPQAPDEPRRPAEVYFVRRQIKHSMKNMWYAAAFVRNMMVDDAITQLTFMNKKAAKIVKECLEEAQEMAVKDHCVEYKSNLHIARSFATKGTYQHAVRFHARGRSSRLDLVYSHYYCCLREGPQPEPYVVTGYDQAEDYIKALRRRKVIYGL